MKKLILLSAAVISLLVSCQKNGTDSKPEDKEAAITITETGNIIIPYDATAASIHYSVENPAEGASVIPETDTDWISDFDTSVEGTVSFSVKQNDTETSRNAILTLTYRYGDAESSAQANIIQENSGFKYITDVKYVFGYYYGNRQSTNYKYNIWLAENPMDDNMVEVGEGLNYCFDIFSGAEPEDMSTMAPAEGTYTLSDDSGPGTFGIQNSRVVRRTADGITTTYFTEGTITITKDGDSFTYVATVTDANGEKHRVTYTGAVALKDFTAGSYISTLHEDYEADLTDATFSAFFYADKYMNGTSNWFITVSPLPDRKDGDFFQLDICAPSSSNMETGIPAGRYEIMDAYYYEFSTLMGFIAGGRKFGSWFWVLDNGQQGSLIAPLIDGYVDISNEGDIYTMKIHATDDAIPVNTITAEWSGTIITQDFSN